MKLILKQLGSGAFRSVFQFTEDLVAKIEPDDNFHNVMEYKLWKFVEETPYLRKWFAPCHFLSSNGKVLLMSKVERRSKEHYPKKIPVFFDDLKYDNFGWIDNQFVCCDYASELIFARLYSPMRMKTAEWWSHDEK